MIAPAATKQNRRLRPLAVLSIQSRVVYGHVGNAAAMPALHGLGIEAWPIDTVSLSSHLGYPEARGTRYTAAMLTPMLDGLEAIGALGDCDCVLSGYLGDVGNAALVADAVARVRRHNPASFYVLDPVMGERGDGLYVAEPVAEAIRDTLLPLADIAIPNQFELGWLANMKTDTVEQSLAAADALRRTAKRDLAILVTGIDTDTTTLTTIAVDDRGAWRVDVARQKLEAHGTGDYFAARLTGHVLRGGDLPTALAAATADTQAVVSATVAAGGRELLLVPPDTETGADEKPAPAFEPVRLR
ncbi:MAG: pyridoxal kinase [Dongiaceae bacterium]